MHYFGEFATTAMTFSLRVTRGWAVVAGLALWASLGARGQDSSGQSSSGQSSSSQSLGDVARKTRKEHASASHVPAQQVTNEDEDGPDAGGVWRVHLCPQTPCYQLSITLPKSPKWSRPAAEPRPVLIPLLGREDDPSRAIRVYAAESLPGTYAYERAERAFLQGWFARPEYFGQAARIVLDEHLVLDGRAATITHFTVNGGGIKYRGLSVVAGMPFGKFGFACVFHEEDSSVADSICDAIIKSARSETLQPAKPQVYPSYPDPPTYPRYDDPPDNDDPE